jgi:hypothetical protein
MRRAVLGIDRVGSTRVVAHPFGLCLVHALIGVCVLFCFLFFFSASTNRSSTFKIQKSLLSLLLFSIVNTIVGQLWIAPLSDGKFIALQEALWSEAISSTSLLLLLLLADDTCKWRHFAPWTFN